MYHGGGGGGKKEKNFKKWEKIKIFAGKFS